MNGKLPLPSSLTNLKGINLLSNQNEQKNQDNYRLYPYERNQWTTFAYVEVDCDLIDNLIGYFEDKKFLNLIQQFHLSLIRGHFIINHHQIKSVIDLIEKNTSIYHQFNVCLSELSLFKNENQTKCFLCFVDTATNDQDLNRSGFCKAIRDSILQFDSKNKLNSNEEFNFHLSIAWCPIEFENQLNQLIKCLNDKRLVEPILIKVKNFKVKIGNQEHKFYLKL